MSASLIASTTPATPTPKTVPSPSPTGFQIAVSETADRTWVSVQGELDILTVPELGSVLRSCTTKGDRSDVVVDLESLEFIDAHGLSVLLESRRRLRARHRKLSIASPSACARRLLSLTGLAELFCVAPAPGAANN